MKMDTADTSLVPLPPGMTPLRWQAEAMLAIRRYLPEHGKVLVSAATGCHARGQMLMRYDGSLVAVEDVVVGDQLMGPDSTPRTVLSLARGRDQMFRIIPVKGEPWIVNGDHVLSLVDTRDKDDDRLVDVTVREWLAWGPNARHLHKLVRRAVTYPTTPDATRPIPAYHLGLLVGDGGLSGGTLTLTSADPECRSACEELAAHFALVVHEYASGGGTPQFRLVKPGGTGGAGQSKANPLVAALTHLGLRCKGEHRRIPTPYLLGPRQDRLDLLAGLIDSDGHLTCGGYDWIAKGRGLAGDVTRLARSLGFAAYMKAAEKWSQFGGGRYWRVSISGDMSVLPTRVSRKRAAERKQIKSVLRTGFRVEALDDGDYFGFALDGDCRYLLDDFTVTHNTGKGTLIAALVVKAARAGKRVLFLVHMDELIDDVMQRAIAAEPALPAGKVKAKVNEIDRPAVFASVQTLRGKRLDSLDKFPFDYVITDECFVAGTPIRMADGTERPVENVAIGDCVLAYDETADAFCSEMVTDTMERRTTKTVTVTVGMVRLRCTANHPFFTRRGWVSAADLTTDDEVKCVTIPSRYLRPVRQPDREALAASFVAHVLRSVPSSEGVGAEASPPMLGVRGDGPGRDAQRGGTGEPGPRVLLSDVRGGVPFSPFFGNHGDDEPCSCIGAHEGTEPDGEGGVPRSHVGDTSPDRAPAAATGRERARTNHRRGEASRGAGLADERDLPRGAREEPGLPDELQDRRGQRGSADRNRDRRRIARFRECPGGRSEEGVTPRFARVDRVEVHECGRDGTAGVVPVYNLSVNRVHTYIAAGIVVHNCHHASARSYKAIYSRVEKVNPRWRHILLTATPFRNAGGGKTSGLGDVVQHLVYEYSLADAITEGALCPLRGIRVETEIDLTGVDPDDEDALAKVVDTPDRNIVAARKYVEHCVTGGERREYTVSEKRWPGGSPRGDGRVTGVAEGEAGFGEFESATTPMRVEVTREEITGGSRLQAIAFCATIEHARNVAMELCLWGIRAEAVWGLDKERKRKIGQFKSGEIDVLCNNNLLSEGFDHKPTGAVLLLRPTQSRGLYAQQVGRVTRVSPGKREGLVIDFVANSDTHDLVSLADLSRPDATGPRVNEGDEVRHRRDAAKSRGLVESVDGYVDPDEQGTAMVLWRHPGRDDLGIVPVEPVEEKAADLVLVKRAPGKTDDEVKIEPSVIGVNEFAISLFGQGGGKRAGWYKYTDSRRRVSMVARGKQRGQSAVVWQARGGGWEAWSRDGDGVRMVASGEFAECERAAAATIGEIEDYAATWLREPATEKQMATLAKFRVARPNLSRGEASMIIELRVVGMLVARQRGAYRPAAGGDDRDPGVGHDLGALLGQSP